MKPLLSPLAAAIALAASGPLFAEHDADGEASTVLPEVVVTAPAMSEPLTVVTDPKAPRQPVPAHDGADYLKSIPGFTMIRKGGTDGDPVFRGMAGSRLGILLDGEHIFGGCGGRMDPPTAYVFPEAYDRITVLKGPQSVLHGGGSSAATVLFERNRTRLAESGIQGRASLTAGSFGRNDQVVEVNGGTPAFQGGLTATRTESDNYEDGNGVEVHSAYERWSVNANLAWTPDEDTWVELSGAQSDGEAAYRDRSMDGTVFDRENISLKVEKRNISDLVRKVEGQVYHNYVDHVMDNYSLRTPTNPMMLSVGNPDRETEGGRIASTLAFTDNLQLVAGIDVQNNQHSARSSSGDQLTNPYQNKPRSPDGKFENYGVFGEATQALGDEDRVIAGLRSDRWHVTDERTAGTVTAGAERSATLTSGFLRHEHDYSAQSTAYAGIGHAQRFPDYWEAIGPKNQSLATNSAFYTRPEQTSQLDAGWIRTTEKLTLSVAAFYNEIHDYILIDTVTKTASPANIIKTTRNVDATSWGGEFTTGYRLASHWLADASLAYVRGKNETDDRALAQQPPLEATFGLTWDNRVYSVGGLLRLVDNQDRVDPGMGNIVGTDIGATPGFGVFSFNGSWRPNNRLLLAAGVDNLFDKAYAEHVSKSGAQMITGYTQTTRVNEPGRNLWLKLTATF
ncbi:MAG: TonB-dependent copper receptor [Gammaproteobacteria bacterium]